MANKDSPNWGEHSSMDSELRINVHASQDPRRIAHTLIHEILHGIRESGMPAHMFTALRSCTPDEAEEAIVTSFTDGLAQVARDNPKLWRKIGKAMR